MKTTYILGAVAMILLSTVDVIESKSIEDRKVTFQLYSGERITWFGYYTDTGEYFSKKVNNKIINVYKNDIQYTFHELPDSEKDDPFVRPSYSFERVYKNESATPTLGLTDVERYKAYAKIRDKIRSTNPVVIPEDATSNNYSDTGLGPTPNVTSTYTEDYYTNWSKK